MKKLSATLAEVNLINIENNIREIKEIVSPSTKIMAVVKADGYGHGAVEVSKAALRAGVEYLSVATLKEAMELREAGIGSPVLILSESIQDGTGKVIDLDISQTVYTYKLAESLSKEAKKKNKKARIHVKIDTGMGRVGVSPKDAVALIKKISALDNMIIEGIFTHFSKAENVEDDFTRRQFKAFKEVLSHVETNGFKIPIKHSANSAAALFYPETHLDMIRIGLSIYGLYPQGNPSRPINLKPALSFKTKVMYLKTVPAGTPLSYGGTYVTNKETTIATLPVGYADGLSRRLSNRGSVLIGGKRFPIVGNVCMDLTLVDAGDAPIKLGDEVVLIGSQGSEEITADEIAELENTINYEVVCGIGKRVPRVYIK